MPQNKLDRVIASQLSTIDKLKREKLKLEMSNRSLRRQLKDVSEARGRLEKMVSCLPIIERRRLERRFK